jgi:hypothetical protein
MKETYSRFVHADEDLRASVKGSQVTRHTTSSSTISDACGEPDAVEFLLDSRHSRRLRHRRSFQTQNLLDTL